MGDYRMLINSPRADFSASSTSLSHESREHKAALRFNDVLRQEAQFIKQSRAQRKELAPDDVRFSLALSGGGVRAAFFEAGVIWRLAEKGLLKNVDTISANSGGSYVAAALASHVHEAGIPPQTADVDKWYLSVVAKMITRMLTNAPFCARECGKKPFAWPTDGSSFLPRFFDMFIFMGVMVFTLVFRPLFMLELLLRPLFDAIDWTFSGAMIAAFCSGDPWGESLLKFWRLSAFRVYSIVLSGMALSAVLAWLCTHCARKRRFPKDKAKVMKTWLYARSTVATLVRLSLFLLMMLLVVMLALNLQIFMFSLDDTMALRKEYYCHEYVDREVKAHWKNCRDQIAVGGELWYTSPEWAMKSGWNQTDMWDIHKDLLKRRPIRFELGYLCILFVSAFTVALFIMPFLPWLLMSLVKMFAPLLVTGVIVLMVQFRVYKPFLPEFSPTHIPPIRMYSIIMLVLPFVPWLSSSVHLFYRRSLQRSFIAGGRDISWGELRSNPYIPLLLFNGTSIDYMRPWDDSPTSELSFSPLHIGGERTSYFHMEEYQSVSKFMALSSAATDAFVIGLNDTKSLRFCLTVLGLSMANPVLLGNAENWLTRALDFNCLKRDPKLRHLIMRRVIQLPALVLSELLFGLMLYAQVTSYAPTQSKCLTPAGAFWASGVLVLLMLVGSFFGFISRLRFLVHWPLVNYIHQLTRFSHCDLVPPRLLYIMDGGIMDATGVMQLVRRRRERILFVLNEDDPKDNMPGLRKLFAAIQREELASLYDPDDPRRDAYEVLRMFQLDRRRTYLRLGILYGSPETSDAKRQTGHLFVIKSRLPMGMERQPLRPRLSEAEIKGEGVYSYTNGDHGSCCLREEELAGCSMCCDCCHQSVLLNCTCGTSRFPNAPIMNMFLTPMYLSSLCRLGYALSGEVVDSIARTDSLAQPWESFIYNPPEMQAMSSSIPESPEEPGTPTVFFPPLDRL